MTTTYNFGQTQYIDEIILEAFERCGIKGDLISGLELVSAQRALNYMLCDWVNRGLQLWTVDQQIITLIPGQATYPMPVGTVDVVADEMIFTSITRVLGGTPASSSGTAVNAFDGNPATACTETSPNGWISYDFGVGNSQSITYIGIQSNSNTNYTIAVQYSSDNTNWYTVNTPVTIPYQIGMQSWIAPYVAPVARYLRILETGGATLDIQELYFDIDTNANSGAQSSRSIARISRQEYRAIPNKTQQGDVSCFLVNRQVQPSITFWNTPRAGQFMNIIYNRKRYFYDVNDFISSIDSPQRFLNAIVAGLASSLALKFATDKYQALSAIAEDCFNRAARDDTERVPLRIQTDYTNYSG